MGKKRVKENDIKKFPSSKNGLVCLLPVIFLAIDYIAIVSAEQVA